MLREFGQRRLQPPMMRLASDSKVRNVFARLMPLLTVQKCSKCQALELCLSACVGFRNIYLKARYEEAEATLSRGISIGIGIIILGLLLLPLLFLPFLIVAGIFASVFGLLWLIRRPLILVAITATPEVKRGIFNFYSGVSSKVRNLSS